MNLQNIDRELRHVFVASPGNVILECDLSQAEARVVKVCTGDPKMIELARRLPTEGDEHTENAAAIFGVPEIEVTSDQRYAGKRVRHASNYGMQAQKLMDILQKDGYTYTLAECKKLLVAAQNQYPQILEWQSNVRRTMLRTRQLYTSWGRVIDFSAYRLDDELFRFGYSYVPHSEIATLLNMYGLKPLYHYLKNGHFRSRIILQVHDSVVLDAYPSEVYMIMEFLKASLERSREYGHVFGHSVELSIPVEYTLGRTWKKEYEFKYLPTRDEVSETLKELAS